MVMETNPLILKLTTGERKVVVNNDRLLEVLEEKLHILGLPLKFESIDNGILVFFSRFKHLQNFFETILFVLHSMSYQIKETPDTIEWKIKIEHSDADVVENSCREIAKFLESLLVDKDNYGNLPGGCWLKFPRSFHVGNFLQKASESAFTRFLGFK